MQGSAVRVLAEADTLQFIYVFLQKIILGASLVKSALELHSKDGTIAAL